MRPHLYEYDHCFFAVVPKAGDHKGPHPAPHHSRPYGYTHLLHRSLT